MSKLPLPPNNWSRKFSDERSLAKLKSVNVFERGSPDFSVAFDFFIGKMSGVTPGDYYDTVVNALAARSANTLGRREARGGHGQPVMRVRQT